VPDPTEPNEQISALNGFKALEAVSFFCHVHFDETVSVILAKSAYGVREALGIASTMMPSIAKPLFEQVNPNRLGVLSSALDLAERYASVLAAGTYGPKAEEIADTLVRHFPTHDYVIDVEQAAAVGLSVRPATPEEAPLLREIAKFFDREANFGFVDELAPSKAADDATSSSNGENAAPSVEKVLTVENPGLNSEVSPSDGKPS
jgi:hypothetical protein